MFSKNSKVTWMDEDNNLRIIGVPKGSLCILKSKEAVVFAGPMPDCEYIAQSIIMSNYGRYVPIYLDRLHHPCSSESAVRTVFYREDLRKYILTGVRTADFNISGTLEEVLQRMFSEYSPYAVLENPLSKYALDIVDLRTGHMVSIQFTHGTSVSYSHAESVQKMSLHRWPFDQHGDLIHV